MPERFRPDPAEFERCVALLCMKIETVAMRGGVPDADCGDLDRMLAAMPPLTRDRVRLMLNGIAIQTEYDEPAMAFAANYLLRLAQDVWETTPHPMTHEASEPSFLRRANPTGPDKKKSMGRSFS